MFNLPIGIAMASGGRILVADSGNNVIRVIYLDGSPVVSTLAGNGTAATADGTGTSDAAFYDPVGVAVHSTGSIFVSESTGNAIRSVTDAGVVTTLAGGGRGGAGFNNAIGSLATFNAPYHVAVYDP
jgi:hypothetical protein